jgi:hypothetical protein
MARRSSSIFKHWLSVHQPNAVASAPDESSRPYDVVARTNAKFSDADIANLWAYVKSGG